MKENFSFKIILSVLVGLTFFQCSKKPEKSINQDSPKKDTTTQQTVKQDTQQDQVISKGDYYFDFDEIVHYAIKKEVKPFDLLEKDMFNHEEQFTHDIFFEEFPADLKYKDLIKNIEIRYDKTLLDTSLYKDINEVFREKKNKSNVEASCIPEYRDILAFRKNGKLIGLAKICFACGQNQILGTSKNTTEFGQSGDYDRLKSLLYQ